MSASSSRTKVAIEKPLREKVTPLRATPPEVTIAKKPSKPVVSTSASVVLSIPTGAPEITNETEREHEYSGDDEPLAATKSKPRPVKTPAKTAVAESHEGEDEDLLREA